MTCILSLTISLLYCLISSLFELTKWHQTVTFTLVVSLQATDTQRGTTTGKQTQLINCMQALLQKLERAQNEIISQGLSFLNNIDNFTEHFIKIYDIMIKIIMIPLRTLLEVSLPLTLDQYLAPFIINYCYIYATFTPISGHSKMISVLAPLQCIGLLVFGNIIKEDQDDIKEPDNLSKANNVRQNMKYLY